MPRKRPNCIASSLQPDAVDAVFAERFAQASADALDRQLSARSWRDVIPPQKKIAVVGKASDSMLLAPYGDPSWQIWVLNDTPVRSTGPGPKEVPRWDVCFEMHPHDERQQKELPAHYAWLRAGGSGKPVFMHPDHWSSEYPDAIPYPLAEMQARFRDYFTCTAAYKLAMAIALEPEEIGIFGVNMCMDEEYRTQRPSVEYWLGMVDALGIKLTLPPQSDLLKCLVPYGRNHPMLAKWTARREMLANRQNMLAEAEKKAEMEQIFLEGAIQDMDYWRQHISSTAPKVK